MGIDQAWFQGHTFLPIGQIVKMNRNELDTAPSAPDSFVDLPIADALVLNAFRYDEKISRCCD